MIFNFYGAKVICHMHDLNNFLNIILMNNSKSYGCCLLCLKASSIDMLAFLVAIKVDKEPEYFFVPLALLAFRPKTIVVILAISF